MGVSNVDGVDYCDVCNYWVGTFCCNEGRCHNLPKLPISEPQPCLQCGLTGGGHKTGHLCAMTAPKKARTR